MKNGLEIHLKLNHSAIKLIDQEDELKWSKNKGSRVCTTKHMYVIRMEEDEREKKSRWKKYGN